MLQSQQIRTIFQNYCPQLKTLIGDVADDMYDNIFMRKMFDGEDGVFDTGMDIYG